MPENQRTKERSAQMQQLAAIIEEFKVVPGRRIPILLTFGELKESTISTLKEAKIKVVAVMPELRMVSVEITPTQSMIRKLNDIEGVRNISVARWTELT